MPLYGGIDLHANNSVVVLLNDQDQVIYQNPITVCSLSCHTHWRRGRQWFFCEPTRYAKEEFFM